MSKRPLARTGLIMAVALVLHPLATLPVSAQEQTQLFGRLFTTPEQRAALDRLRKAKPPPPKPKPKVVEKVEESAPLPEPEPRPVINAFSIDGMVVRKSGPNTAWMDGKQVLGREIQGEGIRIDPGSADPEGISVELPDERGRISLKPGQLYDPAKGEAIERFRPK